MSIRRMQPLMTHCPICQSLYASDHVKLIQERTHVRLYHSTCPSCGHGLFAYVMETHGGVSSLGLVTDAAADDALRLFEHFPISSDECISAHRLMKDHSQELCKRLLDISGKFA